MNDRSKEARSANIQARIDDLVEAVTKLSTSYRKDSTARNDLNMVHDHLMRAAAIMRFVTGPSKVVGPGS